MKMTNAMLLACGLALACASAVSAQTPDEPPRAFVSLGGGFQFAGSSSTDSGSFDLYDEVGSFSGPRKIGNTPFFDAAAGMHITGKISGGVAFSRFAKGSDVSFTALVPHPLFAGELRTIALGVNDLRHTETAIHLQGIYQLFTFSRYDISVFGGPSVILVKEDRVAAINATEGGTPFTAVKLDPKFASSSKTTLGGNVGLDANYRLTGEFGAGVFIRYTIASVKMPAAGDATRKVTVGGPQVGLAVRYRF